MGIFDGLRRRRVGGAASVRARLEGAMARLLRGWQLPLENINSVVASGGPRLLARARELVVTNGYAGNACEAWLASRYGSRRWVLVSGMECLQNCRVTEFAAPRPTRAESW
jgi:hypothetical protein